MRCGLDTKVRVDQTRPMSILFCPLLFLETPLLTRLHQAIDEHLHSSPVQFVYTTPSLATFGIQSGNTVVATSGTAQAMEQTIQRANLSFE